MTDASPLTLDAIYRALQGQTVDLLPMEPSHLQGLWEAGQDERIWDYLFHRVRSIQDMDRLMAEAFQLRDRGIELPFVVQHRETGRILGSTRFIDVTLPHRNLEIGWTWYSPDVWRTRVNTECKHVLLRHCFDTLGMIRVMFKTDGRNVRSQEAIARLGAVKEGVLRSHRILPDGFIRDSVVFSIIAPEWPAVRQRLEGFLAR